VRPPPSPPQGSEGSLDQEIYKNDITWLMILAKLAHCLEGVGRITAGTARCVAQASSCFRALSPFTRTPSSIEHGSIHSDTCV
jgi:hypothetical protein